MFAHELAAELGMTVGEVLDRIDSQEFTRWQAFDKVSPIGGKRLDALAASICATVANAAPFRKSKRTARVSDFLIRWNKPRQSVDAMKKIFRLAKERFEAHTAAAKKHG